MKDGDDYRDSAVDQYFGPVLPRSGLANKVMTTDSRSIELVGQIGNMRDGHNRSILADAGQGPAAAL